jgi:hypothetical protein
VRLGVHFLSARKADLKKGFQHLVVLVLVLVVVVVVVVGTQKHLFVRGLCEQVCHQVCWKNVMVETHLKWLNRVM